MKADVRTILSLAFASALLAACVPGIFDDSAAQAAAPVLIVVEAEPALPVDVSPMPARIVPPSVPVRVERQRVTVPAGCERLVSPLVRSAASSTIGRCVT